MPGNVNTISAKEALLQFKAGASAIDVRSEGEFAEASILGFRNLPILNNEHRHLVGICYKEKGQESAITLGHELVGNSKPQMVQAWREHFENASPGSFPSLVTCWRGGLRSKTACEWLANEGVEATRIEGGYKAMRQVLREELQRPLDLLVLTGLTGSGKTELLWQLEQDFVIDLEAMANHRGSAFGGFIHYQQPSQQTFENTLALKTLNSKSPFICESESRMVGQCVLPTHFKENMDGTKRVVLDCSLLERVRRIHKEYVLDPLAGSPSDETWSELNGQLAKSLERVQRKLGGLKYKEVLESLNRPFRLRQSELKFHEEWITYLLKDYYDPMYTHASQRSRGDIVFKGQWQECYEYLTSCIVGWRARTYSSS